MTVIWRTAVIALALLLHLLLSAPVHADSGVRSAPAFSGHVTGISLHF